MKLSLLINKLQSKFLSAKEKGDLFEQIVKFYLVNDSLQKAEFKRVEFYGNFIANQRLQQPLNLQQRDLGIDLIAVRHDETLCAIQCKYRAANIRISKNIIAPFYAEVARVKQKGLAVTETIVADSTNDDWTDNAAQYLNGNNRRLTWHQIKASNITDWTFINDGTASPLSAQIKKIKPVQQLRSYQRDAVIKVVRGLQQHDRGQLIMACGTGKTLTALRIAESMLQIKIKPGLILFLVPSLSLINQTLQEWFYNKNINFNAIVVCSDTTVGQQYDAIQDAPANLLIKPTTKTDSVLKALLQFKTQAITSLIVFCTYHSLPRIVEAQLKQPTIKFDLVIVDEAHNTAGVKDKNSRWTLVHDAQKILAGKRLYMTATPKVYDYQPTKKTSNLLFKMDDHPNGHFGPVLYRFNFHDAVQMGILSNYKLIISYIKAWDYPELKRLKLTTLTEAEQSEYNEGLEKNEYLSFNLVQLYRAICKNVDLQFGNKKLFEQNPQPMKKLIIFNPRIWQSKLIAKIFPAVIKHTLNTSTPQHLNTSTPQHLNTLRSTDLSIRHIDGKTPAKERTRLIAQLKQNSQVKCQILTNARCLSEGIDVPALDAVAFLNQKTGTRGRTRIGLIQAVGRVMRKSPDKTEGYIILPVVIVKKDPSKQISENNQQLLNSSYRNLVQIVNDLTSHDEEFRDQLNRYKLSRKEQYLLDKIIISGDSEKVNKDSTQFNDRQEHGQKLVSPPQLQLDILSAIKQGIFSCVAQAGNRVKSWTDFVTPLQSFQVKVRQQLKRELQHNLKFKTAIQELTQDLKATINESVTQKAAIDFVLQHYLTLPVFTEVFRSHEFIQTNPISQAVERVISCLDQDLKQLRSHDAHYTSFLKWVKNRTKGLETWQQRDAFIKEFYGQFFKIFDQKTAKKLGIVYTPNEVVDFMLNGAQHLLTQHFSTKFNDPKVNVLDPFAGTGTFLTHLLANPDFISKQNLLSKYHNGVYAKEILLLPYYLHSLNLQATVSNRLPGCQVGQYCGIGLTDTFAEYEQAHTKQGKFQIKDTFLQINQDRIDRQTKTKIDVIISNPTYFRSQARPSDLKGRTTYKLLHTKWKKVIRQPGKSYAQDSLYNSAYMGLYYAFWRLQKNNHQGIIAFIMPNGFLKSRSGGGLRAFLTRTFSLIYVLDLHGEVRAGIFIPERLLQEGENIYGNKSQTGIQILFLVYEVKTQPKIRTVIRYRSINDLLSERRPTQVNKLNALKTNSFKTIFNSSEVKTLALNSENKWFYHSDQLLINDSNYFLNLFTTPSNSKQVFNSRTNGNKTNRNTWCINFSLSKLKANMHHTINFYNQQVTTLQTNHPQIKNWNNVKSLLISNPHSIKWSGDLYKKTAHRQYSTFDANCLTIVLHRPFCQTNLYYSQFWNARVSQTKRLFSYEMKQNRTRVIGICVPQQGGRLDVLAVQSNLVDHDFIKSIRFYPLEVFNRSKNILDSKWNITSNITTFCRRWLHKFYPDLSDRALFAYLYGLLHSAEYKKLFKNFLMYEPPRFCLIKNHNYFMEFVKIGQQLLDLHLKYETMTITNWYGCQHQIDTLPLSAFRLNRQGMRLARKADRSKDYTTIIFNDYITLRNIPAHVYRYKLNGRSVIEQFMNFYRFKRDKLSGIENNPNEFLNQKQPDYFLTTLLRIIDLSLQTQTLIQKLPHINFNDAHNLLPVPTI